jgi:hypothetical protein
VVLFCCTARRNCLPSPNHQALRRLPCDGVGV